MGEIHELFVLALSLVWFAGATPESSRRNVLDSLPQQWGKSQRQNLRGSESPVATFCNQQPLPKSGHMPAAPSKRPKRWLPGPSPGDRASRDSVIWLWGSKPSTIREELRGTLQRVLSGAEGSTMLFFLSAVLIWDCCQTPPWAYISLGFQITGCVYREYAHPHDCDVVDNLSCWLPMLLIRGLVY